jgi:hypothetical protein
MRRREASLALAATPLLLLPPVASANQPPKALSALLPDLRPWGSGEFRRFGFLVYEATLWAGESEQPKPPLALGLTYKRNIEGKAIAEASVDQMRRFEASDAQLKGWGQQMLALFPDVKPGDRIVGLQLADRAGFFFNEQPIGEIDDPAFARAFFAIWLDPRTSEPSLRTALLKR